MKELVEKIVQALVDFPEELDVREIEGSRTDILGIQVSKKDVGKLIGKREEHQCPKSNSRRRWQGEKVYGGARRARESGVAADLQGKIKRLFEDRNYGFIEIDDGRAVYFHGSSVKGMGIRSLSLDQPLEIEVEESLRSLRALTIVPMLQEDPAMRL